MNPVINRQWPLPIVSSHFRGTRCSSAPFKLGVPFTFHPSFICVFARTLDVNFSVSCDLPVWLPAVCNPRWHFFRWSSPRRWDEWWVWGWWFPFSAWPSSSPLWWQVSASWSWQSSCASLWLALLWSSSSLWWLWWSKLWLFFRSPLRVLSPLSLYRLFPPVGVHFDGVFRRWSSHTGRRLCSRRQRILLFLGICDDLYVAFSAKKEKGVHQFELWSSLFSNFNWTYKLIIKHLILIIVQLQPGHVTYVINL